MVSCERCGGEPAWQVIAPDGSHHWPCAGHLQNVLADVPRGLPFTVVGLS